MRPISGPFQVSLTLDATSPSVALDPHGRFIAAWAARDGNALADIYFHAGGAHGMPQGPLTRVTDSGSTGAAAGTPAIAVDDAGNFVVAWSSSDGSGSGIFARRYAADGASRGNAFRVNTYTTQSQWDPAVAMDADGDFVVVWTSSYQEAEHGEVYAQRYAADGTPRGGEMRVNVEYRSNQSQPAVAMDAAGNFAVAWVGGDYYPGDSYSLQGVWLRWFYANGVPRTSDVHANVYTGNQQWLPAIGMSRAGDTVVAWESYGQDRWGNGVFARRFGATGAPLGDEFQVNTTTANGQSGPQVAVDADGDFVIVWQGQAADRSGWDAYGQFFAKTGAPSGGEIKLNADGPYPETAVTVASDPDGDVVAGWRFSDAGGATAMHVSRLRGPEPVDLAVAAQGREDAVGWGADAHYDVTVANQHAASPIVGVGEALDVTVSFLVDGGARGIDSAEGDGWDCHYALTACYYLRPLPPDGVTPPLSVVVRSPWASGTQTLQVMGMAMQLDPDANDDAAMATTSVRDESPDCFNFASRSDVAPGSAQASESVSVTGFDGPLPISVAGEPGSEYSVNDGPFTDLPAEIQPGDSVAVRHRAAFGANVTTTTSLTMQDCVASFTTTTGQDSVPDPFVIEDLVDVLRGAVLTSRAITVTGVNWVTPISVSGGSYSVDGAPFTSASGNVMGGQSVRVQHVSSATFGASVTTMLTIGGISETFISTAVARDTTPDPFSFVPRTGVPRSTEVISGEIVVPGINDAAPISVDKAGKYSIDGGAFTNRPGTVLGGQRVRVRHGAAADFSTSRTTTLTIGGVAGSFTSTTEARDVRPDAFSFADRSGAVPLMVVTSNTLAVSGINDAVPIAIQVESAGLTSSDAAYSVNGGAFTAAPGTVVAGDTVTLRVRAAVQPGVTVRLAVTIGDGADHWDVTTAP